jgi:NAD(P)-dependent dehydrogenase (short-subunit alcohol dehydrogenase family)
MSVPGRLKGPMGPMADQRVMQTLVVGASSGLGRCIGIGLAQRGASVALLARRQELLADAAAEAGPGAQPITCDVTDGISCRHAVAEAIEALGGIDGVVYCPGVGILSRIEDLDLAAWRRAFDTNVAGAALFTAAALPHLVESSGVAVYLDGERVFHPAVARTGFLHRHQGRPRQAGRGLAG